MSLSFMNTQLIKKNLYLLLQVSGKIEILIFTLLENLLGKNSFRYQYFNRSIKRFSKNLKLYTLNLKDFKYIDGLIFFS